MEPRGSADEIRPGGAPLDVEVFFPRECAAKFRPISLLATGGFGSVFLAEQVNLGRKVALKLLHAHILDQSDQVRRFIHEAQVAAAISHPGLVKLIDHGVEDGVPWIAYEYVPGRTLADLLRSQGPFDPVEAVDAVCQIARALEAAHEKGVLHRDIKPANVLKDEEGRYKLTDFGISKWTGSGTVQTMAGEILGTPEYVAPEYVLGDESTQRTDLYALGVVLFELLTGRPPFTDPAVLRILDQHLKTPPPLPSLLAPAVPKELDKIVLKALQKDPRHRHQTAAELVCDLERWTTGLRSLAAADSPQRSAMDEPSRKRMTLDGGPVRSKAPRARRRRLSRILTTGAAALALILLFTIVELWLRSGSVEAPPGASPPPLRISVGLNESTPQSSSGPLDPAKYAGRIQGLLDQVRLFDLEFRKEASQSGLGLISSAFVRPKNSGPLMSTISNMVADLELLVYSADRDGLTGITWLEIESVARRISRAVFHGVHRAEEAKSFWKLMSDVCCRTPRPDLCRRCLTLSVVPYAEWAQQGTAVACRGRAKSMGEAYGLLETDRGLNSDDEAVVFAKLRFLVDGASCWAAVARPANGQPGEKEDDTKLLETRRRILEVGHLAVRGLAERQFDGRDRQYELFHMLQHLAELADWSLCDVPKRRLAFDLARQVLPFVDVSCASVTNWDTSRSQGLSSTVSKMHGTSRALSIPFDPALWLSPQVSPKR